MYRHDDQDPAPRHRQVPGVNTTAVVLEAPEQLVLRQLELEPAGEDDARMYTRTWSVEGAGAAVSLRVNLQWRGRAGAARSILLETLMDPVADGYGAAAWTDIDFIRLE